MGDQYLIPANSKKSMLILGFFNWIDLIVFGTGVTLTMIMLIAVKSSSPWVMGLILAPGLTSGLLVLPVPNYHNVMTLLGNIRRYIAMQKQYKWRGWCITDGKDS